MVHNAVNNDVVRHRHVVARIVEQVGASGVVQRVRVHRAAVAAHKFPHHRLRRQLRAVRVHIEAVIAAITVGHGQRHGIPLIPRQITPRCGGILQIAAGGAHLRLHTVGRDSLPGVVPGEILELVAGVRPPLGHRRLVLVVAVLVAAADGARDRGGVGGHDGQPHDSHQ